MKRINDTLPGPVYALLSGLNSATVGIVALAAVQLSGKAITDRLTRALVFLGGTAGMLYNTLWYFPVLMTAGAIVTLVWDLKWLHRLRRAATRRSRQDPSGVEQAVSETENRSVSQSSARVHPSSDSTTRRIRGDIPNSDAGGLPGSPVEQRQPAVSVLTPRGSLVLMAAFFAAFGTLMVLRGVLSSPKRAFSLFANLILAGTIIFGGGPVVIPLLREYVVAEGWVSTRDFLLGLAIIQAFPGPNFNFAVYLGALAVAGTGVDAAAGALIGYVAIFLPGLALHTATTGLWRRLRRYQAVTSALRGINASAVGLIYAAVYRLWTMGFLSSESPTGKSLGDDPWWLVTAATAFVGGMWFGVAPPVAILLGGAMGLVWFGVNSA